MRFTKLSSNAFRATTPFAFSVLTLFKCSGSFVLPFQSFAFIDVSILVLIYPFLYPITFGSLLIWFDPGREGTFGCILHQSPKTFSYSLASRSWELFLNFNLLLHESECLNASTTNCNLREGLFCVSSLGNYINLLSYPFRSPEEARPI